ncbi:MAG: nitrous oxide reductase family maturation protein NosD [Acidimicrobiia bacterium]
MAEHRSGPSRRPAAAVVLAAALAAAFAPDLPGGPDPSAPGVGRGAPITLVTELAAARRGPVAGVLAVASGRVLHVAAGAPAGGDGTSAAPFAGVQAALEAAGPGDTVLVAPGRYPGRIVSVRAGTPDAPIRLVGTGGAHLFADGAGRLLTIRHDHLVVEGFELSTANIAVVLEGADGVRLDRNWIHGTRSECVRLRAGASANVVVHNVIRECGLAFDGANGEAIYVGTAPEKLHENAGPDGSAAGPDHSDGNLLWGNDIVVWGECVDIKEDADDNQVIENWCRGGSYASGAGLSSRGHRTVFVNNWSTDHLGSGLQLAGDRPGDGSGSVVTGNVLTGNAQYGLKIVQGATPQQRLCGNVLAGNGRAPATPLGAGADGPC